MLEKIITSLSNHHVHPHKPWHLQDILVFGDAYYFSKHHYILLMVHNSHLSSKGKYGIELVLYSD